MFYAHNHHAHKMQKVCDYFGNCTLWRGRRITLDWRQMILMQIASGALDLHRDHLKNLDLEQELSIAIFTTNLEILLRQCAVIGNRDLTILIPNYLHTTAPLQAKVCSYLT
jgi:hypothetical protein